MRTKRSARPNLKLLGDLAKAAGPLSGLRDQIKGFVRDGVERVMSELDLVSRDEFDRAEAMIQKARLRQEELEDRLAALEGKGKKTQRKRK